jgi:hypothetical protein
MGNLTGDNSAADKIGHFDATVEAFLFIHHSTGKYLSEIAAHLCSSRQAVCPDQEAV